MNPDILRKILKHLNEWSDTQGVTLVPIEHNTLPVTELTSKCLHTDDLNNLPKDSMVLINNRTQKGFVFLLGSAFGMNGILKLMDFWSKYGLDAEIDTRGNTIYSKYPIILC